MNYVLLHPQYRELALDDHLRLITPDTAHAKESLAWVTSPDVVAYMGADFPSPTLEGEQRRLEEILGSTDEYSWMISVKGNIVGNVCINMIEECTRKHGVKCGNLTILIGQKTDWGKGMGTKICAAVLQWAFQAGGFACMTARALQENTASITMLQKLGFEEAESEPYDGLVHGKPSTWRNFILNNPHV